MRTYHPHAKVSSQITRITTLTCSLCSLHKEHSRQIVSTCFNPSCFRVSTCFSCFNKSLFRTHSQSRQGLHQCLNLPTVATNLFVFSNLRWPNNICVTAKHIPNTFQTFQHHHFARTKVSTLDILGPIYVSGCKRSCASMYDEHMIPKILTRPAASRMIRSTSQQAALSLSDSVSL